MGVTDPSPRVSVCRSGRQHGGQGSRQRPARKGLWSQVGSRAGKAPHPAGQSLWWPMPKEVSVAWSSPLGCGAGLTQQWSGACLSCTWKVVDSALLGLSDKCLGSPGSKHGISVGACLRVVPLWRHSCSDHVCSCLGRCLLGRCVYSDLGSFPLEPKCHG